MTDTTVHTTPTDLSAERRDLLETLATHRETLLQTAAGLTDDQARQSPTASSLSIGGLIKHVAATESSWAGFMRGEPMGPPDVDWSNPDPAMFEAYQQGFVLGHDESLAEALEHYRIVAAVTDELVATCDLDRVYPLPPAPWLTATERSVRRAAMHIVAETAQHAGHADIIRETLDGTTFSG